jgi:hypothetical protein
VKVFFDECVPRPLKRLLPTHDIRTAQEMDWGQLKNGELLRRAEENGFQVFVTSDKNLSYQQNLSGRQIAILVLATNYWPALRNHVQIIESALSSCQPGHYLDLSFPTS